MAATRRMLFRNTPSLDIGKTQLIRRIPLALFVQKAIGGLLDAVRGVFQLCSLLDPLVVPDYARKLLAKIADIAVDVRDHVAWSNTVFASDDGYAQCERFENR